MHTLDVGWPDDFHLHLRDGEMMKLVLPYTARHFRRALIMPNLKPNAVLTAKDAVAYKGRILQTAEETGFPEFEPFMTIEIRHSTTPNMIRNAKRAGVIAGKIYPVGVTTNSQDGIRDFDDPKLHNVFSAMQDEGMVLCLHGEAPAPVYCLDREQVFLSTLLKIVEKFPKLKITLEHVTTRDAVEAVEDLPDTVAATITPHHLVLTTDDVIGDALRPHNFCKPVAKRVEDRRALLRAAMSRNPKFFLGTDSAPHARESKEQDCGCAGVFCAPVALPLLVKIFRESLYDKLHLFMSHNGAKHYNLNLPSREEHKFVEQPFEVPKLIGNVVPFLAGQTLPYSLA